jgi:hypothetical protein
VVDISGNSSSSTFSSSSSFSGFSGSVGLSCCYSFFGDSSYFLICFSSELEIN